MAARFRRSREGLGRENISGALTQDSVKEKEGRDMELLYSSTRSKEKKVTASEAILKGLAEDGGLFVPESIPKLDVPMAELKGDDIPGDSVCGHETIPHRLYGGGTAPLHRLCV